MPKVKTGHYLHDLLEYWGEIVPEKEAVIDGHRRLTYGELRHEGLQIEIALSKIGVKKGDFIILCMPNWHEFVTLFLTLAKMGVIIVPANISMTQSELMYLIKEMNPKMVFLSSPEKLQWLNESEYEGLVVTIRFDYKGHLSYTDLIEYSGDNNQIVKQVEIKMHDDVATILFTSGTTGYPKGVQLTHYNLFSIAISIGERLQCTSQDIFLVPNPICHMYGIVTGLIIPIYFGGKIIMEEKFDAARTLALVAKEKATVIYGVPTMYIQQLETQKKQPHDLSSLRVGHLAGAYCPEWLIKELNSKLLKNVVVGYGSTETVGVSMTELEDDLNIRSKTVGRPYAGVEVRLVNKNRQLIHGENVVGELACKGSGVMKGYYNNPEATDNVIDEDGWYYTGDLASIDDAGYITIKGRVQEIIIRSGNNIYPAEIAKMYNNHPEVSEVDIQGVPDPVLGERTVAFVQLIEGSQENEESLREYAKGKVAKYKIPDQIIITSEMPRLNNGKIDKLALLRKYKVNYMPEENDCSFKKGEWS